MKKSIIVGKTNAGKTLFMINFAEYIGLKRIFITQEFYDGRKLKKEMTIDMARRYLSSSQEYKTQCIQSIGVNIPVYKGRKELKILDSSGMIDGVHPDLNVRNGIIQTLEELENADLILHIIDVSTLLKKNYISEIDRQIIQYGGDKSGYLLIANKTDLDEEGMALKKLKDSLNKQYLVPTSALYKKGFKEVKSFVIRSI